jgi:hypothetical protein
MFSRARIDATFPPAHPAQTGGNLDLRPIRLPRPILNSFAPRRVAQLYAILFFHNLHFSL